MLLLVVLFAIWKIVFTYCMFRDAEERNIPDKLNIEKNTTLNTECLKRGTKRINMKMT